MYGLIKSLFGKNRTKQVEVERKLTKLERAKSANVRLSNIKAFDARIASSVFVHCCDGNIVSFIERVNSYVEKLEYGEDIKPIDCFKEQSHTSLDKFFTDEQGMYVRQSALLVLTSQMDILFSQIEKQKEKNEDNAKYLERLLGKTFNSLISIEETIDQAKPK